MAEVVLEGLTKRYPNGLDEPLSNLDAKLRVQTRGEIMHIQREVDVTTFYVTHDQVEVGSWWSASVASVAAS